MPISFPFPQGHPPFQRRGLLQWHQLHRGAERPPPRRVRAGLRRRAHPQLHPGGGAQREIREGDAALTPRGGAGAGILCAGSHP